MADLTDMAVSLAGVGLKNPIVAASGTFGFGREYNEYFDISRLGGICVKGLTLHPREGNPPPRIAEAPSGCLNSVGLQNPGVCAFIRDELPFLRAHDIAVIVNISGDTVEEYGEMAKILGASADMLEVNISCPNIHEDGLNFGATERGAALVTEAVAKNAKVPVMVKLSPNVTDISSIAIACEESGAHAISLINTLLGMRIDIDSRRPVLRKNIGGLSGPAVLPVALRAVWQVSRSVRLPILGMGGVSSAETAVEMMLAGATAVGVGAAIFGDPHAPMKILHRLAEYAKTNGIASISELTGAAKAWD